MQNSGMNKPSKSKAECEHSNTQKAKDAYGKMAKWCSNCGTRLSKNPQDDRPAPGTVGHRISLLESVMFGQSKVKDFPQTELSEFREQLKHACRNYPKQPTDAETLRALQFAMQPLQLEDRKPCYHIASLGFCPFEEAAEHEADLRHESLMADESEHGPRCNLPDDEGWRNV